MRYIPILLCFLCLTGCSWLPGTPTLDGGSTQVEHTRTTYPTPGSISTQDDQPQPPKPPLPTTDPNLNDQNNEIYKDKLAEYHAALPEKASDPLVVSEDRTKITIKGPENAQTPSTLSYTITPDGYTYINSNAGASQDVSKLMGVMGKIQSLNPVTLFGCGLIVVALAVGILLKEIKWAIAIGLTGVGVIAVAFFLQTYSVLCFIVGLLALGAWIWYTLHTKKLVQIANTDNMALVEGMRQDLTEEADQKWFKGVDGLKPLAHQIQNKSTVKLIKQIQTKEDL